jgi:site-specific DNA recombinase
MPSVNGPGPKRAILYARVSTDEQARSGYSLAQQLEALREYAAREGYEVIEEVQDPGQSGASLERPGMDRVRDLVAAGGVSIVLAQDRDRLAREPAYLYLLREEFAGHGTKVKALNDRGDDSPEGQLTDGILDQLAKFERAKTMERSRRGKLRKARQGRIVAGHRPHYGFRYNENQDGYEVDEDEMRVVRRIFEMIGIEGSSIRAVRRALEAQGLPSPSGGRRWSQMFVRSAILDDVYLPHAYEELEALVSPEVAARLDPDRSYGIYWYNTRRNTYRPVVEGGPNGRTYRKRRKVTQRPREEWIAVPVPDCGVPREWVDAAREIVEGNRWPPSTNRRFWELSGGLLRCSRCDGRMRPLSTLGSREPEARYFYYRCGTQWDNGECTHKKLHRAGDTERRVWAFVRDLFSDPERLRADLERMIEMERAAGRGDPDREARAWHNKLAEAERKRDGYLDLAAEGIMGHDELREKLSALDEIRSTAKRELEAIRSRRERLEELERDKDALLDSYAQMTPEALDALTPEERHRVYGMLGLRATITMDGTLEVSGTFNEGESLCGMETQYSMP